jgi:hypothetical protein
MYFNKATNFTVVNVNYGTENCVILYTPTFPECGYLLKLATEAIVEATNQRAKENPAQAREFTNRANALIESIDNGLACKPIIEIKMPAYIDRLLASGIRKRNHSP